MYVLPYLGVYKDMLSSYISIPKKTYSGINRQIFNFGKSGYGGGVSPTLRYLTPETTTFDRHIYYVDFQLWQLVVGQVFLARVLRGLQLVQVARGCFSGICSTRSQASNVSQQLKCVQKKSTCM